MGFWCWHEWGRNRQAHNDKERNSGICAGRDRGLHHQHRNSEQAGRCPEHATRPTSPLAEFRNQQFADRYGS
jgi:hypothetical protein